MLPEEATVVDDTSTVGGGGGAVADNGLCHGEASGAVGGGEVVPALNHGVNGVGTPNLLGGGEVSGGELRAEVGEGGVEIGLELRSVGGVVLAASLVQQLRLRVRFNHHHHLQHKHQRPPAAPPCHRLLRHV